MFRSAFGGLTKAVAEAMKPRRTPEPRPIAAAASKRLRLMLEADRKARGLGITDYARLAGLDLAAYSRYRNGRHGWRLDKADEICRQLGITFTLGESA